ncbi:MAG: leucine-rich repeat protein [Prevotella sp.]
MKKRVLLSSVLLILCLIQAVAGSYYYKIKLINADGSLGGWSPYIEVSYDNVLDIWRNSLERFLAGYEVTDGNQTYTLPDKNPSKIWGIVFANEKGRDKGNHEDILEGNDYDAWKTIREHIKYLELRDYVRSEHSNKGYFMNMFKLETLELPKSGMNVGGGELDCQYYFANADNLKQITIYDDNARDTFDITAASVKDKQLLNRVGPYMFANCYSLPTKYINRLIKNATEIRNNAFYADNGNRDKFKDGVDNNSIPIEISSSTTVIGKQAFLNRVKETGLNISSNNLNIGQEAFNACDNLARISVPANAELSIDKDAFAKCKQLNTFENLATANIKSLGTGVFGDCRSMTNEFVNGVLASYARNGATKIPAYLFYGCNGQDGHDGKTQGKNRCTFTKLIIPAEFTVIGDGAFASSNDAKVKLDTITVNAGVAPQCLDYSGATDEYAGIKNTKVFKSVDPNTTTVVFANAAEGWNSAEDVGFLTYMKDNSEFERLLTKDLYSDKTEYINVPQQHAIVKMHRKLKKGWNTICLPFGVNYRYCTLWGNDYETKQAHNARIIVNGLTNGDKDADNDRDFKVGVYRGYWKEGKVFMFLDYKDFNTYPMDFCETFLVKLREKDIKADGVYTFWNVDLNYRWTADGSDGNSGNWTSVIYKAEEMPAQPKAFNGNVNAEAPAFNGRASYDEYVLQGSVIQRTGTVGDSGGRITTNDYFFQQDDNGAMKLYRYEADKKYGIRGFSGWFHKIANDASVKEFSIGLFSDNDTTPIEMIKNEELNGGMAGNVYSMSGVLMKANATDLDNLPKGIYIVNGKKYIVK